MKKLVSTIAIAIAIACATNLHAAELGDAAKTLDIKEWVKGSAVDLAAGKGKTIYVIEFWATWCPPCRTSIPHLTEMQKKFKDKGVIFVGVTDEKSDVVKKFVEKMGDKMDYRVAIDGGKTSADYMEAFGAQGIPHAFIVDKEGKIIWQGHPMSGLDKVLDKVVEGKYDIAEAKALAKKEAEGEKRQGEVQKKLQQLAKAIMADDDKEKIKALEEELVALDKELGGIMQGEKFDPANFRERVLFSQKIRKYQQALMTGSDTNELAALEKTLETDAPKGFDLKEFKKATQAQMEMQKSGKVLEGYIEAVGADGDATKAAEFKKKVEALNLKNPEILNQLAWAILAEDMVKTRDLPFALSLAKRAVELSDSKEPAIVDTYARALFDNGKTDEAIAQVKKAIEMTEDEDIKTELKASLKTYEAKSKPSKEAK